MLAASRHRRLAPAPDHPGRLRARHRPAAVVRRDEPARPHRPAARAASRPRPPSPAAGTQLQLPVPGESLHSGKPRWVASNITGQALTQTRRIAAELAGTRGWNPRIITETGRALAVVLAGHIPGERLTILPEPIAADVGDWLRTRSQGGPRSHPRHADTVRMNFNRVRPLLLHWAGHYGHHPRTHPGPSSPPGHHGTRRLLISSNALGLPDPQVLTITVAGEVVGVGGRRTAPGAAIHGSRSCTRRPVPSSWYPR